MSNVEQQNRLVEWFRRWRTPLRRFLASRNAVRPADFDDVAQEVFLRLLRYDAAQIVEHPQAYPITRRSIFEPASHSVARACSCSAKMSATNAVSSPRSLAHRRSADRRTSASCNQGPTASASM